MADHPEPGSDDEFSNEPVLGRRNEQRILRRHLHDSRRQHIHIYGPRGTGKTLVTQAVLDSLPRTTPSVYLSCIQYDTQYRVLAQLCAAVADCDIGTGYHTSQLQQHLVDNFLDRKFVLVLDEIDFLLHNDGSDLLYYLTRHLPDSLDLVLLSANHPDLSTVVDDRTYSTLQPHRLPFRPYQENDALRILAKRAEPLLADLRVMDGSLTTITSTTRNIRYALHWLTEAANTADTTITPDLIETVQSKATDRYRSTLLADFTPHHHLLLEAIDDLTSKNGDSVHSGAVYQRYDDLCQTTGRTPLTNRRISDYLKHLELLGIIDSEYHYGGEKGKTREIELQQA